MKKSSLFLIVLMLFSAGLNTKQLTKPSGPNPFSPTSRKQEPKKTVTANPYGAPATKTKTAAHGSPTPMTQTPPPHTSSSTKVEPKSQFKNTPHKTPYGPVQKLIFINNVENKDRFNKAQPLYLYSQNGNIVQGILKAEPLTVTENSAPPVINGNLLVSQKNNEPKAYNPQESHYQLMAVTADHNPGVYALTMNSGTPSMNLVDTSQRTLIINNTSGVDLLLTVQGQVETKGLIETENETAHIFMKVPAHSVTPFTIHNMKDGKTLKPQDVTFWLEEYPSDHMNNVMFHESNKKVSNKTHTVDASTSLSVVTVTSNKKFGKHFLRLETYE